jgi:hypothetical protein
MVDHLYYYVSSKPVGGPENQHHRCNGSKHGWSLPYVFSRCTSYEIILHGNRILKSENMYVYGIPAKPVPAGCKRGVGIQESLM